MRDAEPEKKIEISAADQGGQGRKPEAAQVSGSNFPGSKEQTGPKQPDLIERMLERGNLLKALQAVEANRGAAGVDGMEVEQLRKHLREHWAGIKEQILKGRYEPRPVRRVDIPKAGGGTRMLGIPTVLDRLIQQAIHQILSPLWEEGFSAHSYGFRPGRSAAQAVRAAQGHIQSGKRWVVDVDLEKFFDRVNHAVLMARVARKVKDQRLLKLIRRYLESGIMQQGLVEPRSEDTPQGGPLSPLLSNILLDDLDKELEKRGHRFCRYADDCNIYVGSRRAGQRVMTSATEFLEQRLKLKVNRQKSAVGHVSERKFLGHRLLNGGDLGVAPQSQERLKDTLRELTSRSAGQSLPEVIRQVNQKFTGWIQYFRMARMKGLMQDIGQWLRRRLRCLRLKQCKRARAIAQFLMSLGESKDSAYKLGGSGKGWWRLADTPQAHRAMSLSWFKATGLLNPEAVYLAVRNAC